MARRVAAEAVVLLKNDGPLWPLSENVSVAVIGADGFGAIYGGPLPSNEPERRGAYTLDTPLGDMRQSWAALTSVQLGAV